MERERKEWRKIKNGGEDIEIKHERMDQQTWDNIFRRSARAILSRNQELQTNVEADDERQDEARRQQTEVVDRGEQERRFDEWNPEERGEF